MLLKIVTLAFLLSFNGYAFAAETAVNNNAQEEIMDSETSQKDENSSIANAIQMEKWYENLPEEDKINIEAKLKPIVKAMLKAHQITLGWNQKQHEELMSYEFKVRWAMQKNEKIKVPHPYNRPVYLLLDILKAKRGLSTAETYQLQKKFNAALSE